MANKIVIDTTINATDAKREIKSLESELKKLEAEKKKTDETFATYKEMELAPDEGEIKKYNEIIQKIKELNGEISELKNPSKVTKEQEEAIDAAILRLKERQEAERKYAEEASKIAEEEEAEIQRQIKLQKELQEQSTQTPKAQAEQPATAPEVSNNLEKKDTSISDLGDNAAVTNQKIVDLVDRLKDLKYQKKKLEDTGYSFGFKDYEEVISEISKLEQELNKYKDTILKNVKSASEKASKSIRNIGDSAKKGKSGFSIGLKSMLKYAFGIRSLFALINKLRSAMVEGFKNLAQFSNGVNPANTALSNLKSSLTQLKNSFAVAFSPILTVVEPILTTLINLLSTAMNYIGQFFSALTGASTYIKATKVQENYAKSLNGTASAAKKAANNLSSLDELNIVQKENDGGGGASGGTAIPKNMFEKSPISEETAKIADKIRNAFDGISKKAIALSKIFKKGFFEGLGDPTARLQSIQNSIESIKKSLKGIFDAEFQREFGNFLNTAAESFGIIAGSAASIGLTIATNLLGGIAGYLESEQGRIKEFFLNMFDISGAFLEQAANFADTFSDIFEVFANENAQKITEDFIAIFSNPLMSVIEIVSQLGNDIFKLLTQPIIDSKEQIKNTLEGVLSNLSDYTGSVRTILTDSFSMLGELYNQHVSPVFEKISSLLTSFLQEHLLPLIETWGEFYSFLGEQLLVLWQEILQPFFQWFGDEILPFITSFCETVIERFLDAAGVIEDITNYLIGEVFTGLIKFIVGVFTLDWKKAWQGIASILVGIWNIIAVTIETTINNVIKLINNLIESVNKISSAVGIPSIPKIKSINIPKAKIPFLATGAVIPPNAPFMAMLGDQRNGTNLEAPEDLIRQIVREEAGGSREMLELLMQIAQNTRDAADKDLTIGDREIAKANMRGQLEMGYTLITEG